MTAAAWSRPTCLLGGKWNKSPTFASPCFSLLRGLCELLPSGRAQQHEGMCVCLLPKQWSCCGEGGGRKDGGTRRLFRPCNFFILKRPPLNSPLLLLQHMLPTRLYKHELCVCVSYFLHLLQQRRGVCVFFVLLLRRLLSAATSRRDRAAFALFSVWLLLFILAHAAADLAVYVVDKDR